MNKRVLIINRGSDTDNIGDQAINYALRRMFENNSAVVESVNYTLFYNRKGGKFVSVINNLKKAISIARVDYDIVVIGGGQLILSNKTFPVSFFLWVIILKIFSSSKLFLFGVGVVDNYTNAEKKLFKVGLKRMQEVYVRDAVSKRNLEKIFSIKSECIPDPVFGISKLYTSKVMKNKNALFGITTYSSIKRYGYIKDTELEYLKNQAVHVFDISENYNVKLIYNTNSDYKYTLKLQRLLLEKYSFKVDILETRVLEDYIDMISSAKKVISSRMHALIVAKSYGVEIEPIVRNKKLLTFKEEHKDISIDVAYRKNNDIIKSILNDN